MLHLHMNENLKANNIDDIYVHINITIFKNVINIIFKSQKQTVKKTKSIRKNLLHAINTY